MKPEFKSGAFQPYTNGRYSNTTGISGVFQEIPGSGDYTQLPSDYYSSGSSSSGGSFNWGSFANNIASGLTTMASSIWGNDGRYQAQAYQAMYKEQQRTNTVLWVVIGLILALGVFLVIRKTK